MTKAPATLSYNRDRSSPLKCVCIHEYGLALVYLEDLSCAKTITSSLRRSRRHLFQNKCTRQQIRSKTQGRAKISVINQPIAELVIKTTCFCLVFSSTPDPSHAVFAYCHKLIVGAWGCRGGVGMSSTSSTFLLRTFRSNRIILPWRLSASH